MPLTVLSTSIMFCDICAQACTEIFSIFLILFLPFLFLSFSFPFAVVLPVKKILRFKASSRRAIFCSGRKFCSEFVTQLLSIFVHISGSIGSITLIWVLLERFCILAEIQSKDDANFSQRCWRQKPKKGQGLSPHGQYSKESMG